MTTADTIRDLARQGLDRAGIARRLGIRHRRVHSVPGRSGATPSRGGRAARTTSIRIGAALKAEIAAGRGVAILVASPPAPEWNGLPVAGDAGLELGLIQAFDLPWNRRGT